MSFDYISTTFKGVQSNELEEIAEQYGTPVYILSEGRLLQNFETLRACMGRHHPRNVIAYSYKTNYLGVIRRLLHEAGAWAEVVSGLEHDLARSIGVPGERTIVNGPYKPSNELDQMIAGDALIQVDNIDEVRSVIVLARRLGRAARIGIRLFSPFAPYPWTKFGFAVGPALNDLLDVILANRDALSLQSLHAHIGTNIADPNFYRQTAALLGKQALLIEKRLGVNIAFLDLGGGFPVSTAPPTDLDGWNAVGIDHYIEAIFAGLSEELKDDLLNKHVIIEPGRFLVDDAMALVCSVVALKELEQRSVAILDAGVNVLPSAFYRSHAITNLTRSNGNRVYDVYGPLCMQGDLLAKAWEGSELLLGDKVLISNAGAYSTSQSVQFIRPRPPIVSLNSSGARLVSRIESASDFLRLEVGSGQSNQ